MPKQRQQKLPKVHDNQPCADLPEVYHYGRYQHLLRIVCGLLPIEYSPELSPEFIDQWLANKSFVLVPKKHVLKLAKACSPDEPEAPPPPPVKRQFFLGRMMTEQEQALYDAHKCIVCGCATRKDTGPQKHECPACYRQRLQHPTGTCDHKDFGAARANTTSEYKRRLGYANNG